MVPSPRKINRIPTFLLQNPAARAGPWLSYTKPETVCRDGSNEVTWACSESLLALLFTHHRFLLLKSIDRGWPRARARAADSQICTASLAWFRCCWKGSRGPTRPEFCVLAALACPGWAKAVGPPPARPSRVPRRSSPPPRSAMATTSARRQRPWRAGGLATSNRCNLLGGMPTGARGPRCPGSTVLAPPISLLGLGSANLGR